MTHEKFFPTRADQLAAIISWEQRLLQEKKGQLQVSGDQLNFWTYQAWAMALQSVNQIEEADLVTIIRAQYEQDYPLTMAVLEKQLPYDRSGLLIDQLNGILILDRYNQVPNLQLLARQAKDQLHMLVCDYLIHHPLISPEKDWQYREKMTVIALQKHQQVLDRLAKRKLPSALPPRQAAEFRISQLSAVTLTKSALELQQRHFCMPESEFNQNAFETECSNWFRELGDQLYQLQRLRQQP
jgi:hypothetical protein